VEILDCMEVGQDIVCKLWYCVDVLVSVIRKLILILRSCIIYSNLSVRLNTVKS